MIERLSRQMAPASAPRADLKEGMAFCPICGKVLAEPLGGAGHVAVWCRRCRRNIIVPASAQ